MILNGLLAGYSRRKLPGFTFARNHAPWFLYPVAYVRGTRVCGLLGEGFGVLLFAVPGSPTRVAFGSYCATGSGAARVPQGVEPAPREACSRADPLRRGK